MRVAIVGTGPAGCYALKQLLEAPQVTTITVIDRLPTPGGLIRAGVAPDHHETKKVFDGFARAMRDPRVSCHFGVEVGRHVSAEELRRHHHAVLYAVGAAGSRRLGIPGEDLAGSHAATEFVAWYNGHPDHAARAFELGAERVVVVGTGNVALDIARVLTLAPEVLARTDIADHALAALRAGGVREVVLLARRGPDTAAFTSPELLALTQLQDIDVVVDLADLAGVAEPAAYGARLKLRLLRELAARTPRGGKRIVLRFHAAPAELLATGGSVTGVAVRDTRPAGGRPDEVLPAGLVLRAIGYRGEPLAGVPYDEATGTAPHAGGRVQPGVYVAGWFKRGPSGVIGTNKHDAAETVAALLADAPSLPEPTGESFAALVAERVPEALRMDGFTRIDGHEREAGARGGRPRVKLTGIGEMLAVARG